MGKKIIIIMLVFMFFPNLLLCATNINQSDIPITLSTPGEIYTVQEDLSSNSGPSISVSASNIVLDFNGNTLTYAISGTGDGVVIASGTATNFEMYGGSIVQGGNYQFSNPFDNSDLGVGGLKIHNMTLIAEQYIASCIEIENLSTESLGVEIYSNIISMNDTTPTQSRGTRSCISISGDANITGVIHNNTLTAGANVYKNRCSTLSVVGGGAGILEIYENTSNMNQEDQGEGFRSYLAKNDYYHDNIVNQNSSDCRAFLIDGGTDGNRYINNTVNMNLQGGFGTGFRLRYDSDSNEIAYNTIISGDTHLEYGISIGEYCDNVNDCGAIGLPSSNIIHHNTVSSTVHGIRPREGSEDTRVYCNSFTTGGSGYPISINPYDNVNNTMTDLVFSYNTLIGGVNKVVVDTTYGNPVDPVIFCVTNPALNISDFTGGVVGIDYLITTSGCQDGAIDCQTAISGGAVSVLNTGTVTQSLNTGTPWQVGN